MMGLIQDNWEWVVVTASGIFGAGGLFQRTNTLGKRVVALEKDKAKCVTIDDCIKSQSSCEKLHTVYRESYQNSIDRIEKSFTHMKDCNDSQHKEIMVLLGNKKDNLP